MRINRIEIDNFMRLGVVQLTPEGNVVQITGENGSGKSSFMNAIFCCLAGAKAVPARPIRDGEQSARITLDLGEVVITRKFRADGETSIVVETADGARFQKPQQLLASLYSAIAFDPMIFLRAEPKERLEILRKLVPLDVDVDALDGQNARDYELRRDWNRKVASLEEREATLRAGIDPAMDTTPVDVEALTEEMARASDHNAQIDRTAVEEARQDDLLHQLRQEHADLAEEIARQQQRLATMAARIATGEQIVAARKPLAEKIDVSDLRQQINAAMRTNAERDAQERQRALHRRAVDELTAARAMSQDLTNAMEARIAEKAAAIARAPMPVEGLSFGDGDVLFKGVPFDQASTAEQWIVAMAIGVAGNPKLLVVLIRDGSLLDKKSLAIVSQIAKEKGLQVFMEVVRTGKGVGVVFEAGQITEIDGVPVRAEELEGAGTGA